MKKSIVFGVIINMLFRFITVVLLPVILLIAMNRGEAGEKSVQHYNEIVRPAYGELQKKTFDVLSYYDIQRPKIGLVLSGGGARGVAHLGVLEVFEENNIPIDFIVGASMGSLIGGLYAIGYSTEALHALVDTTDWQHILSLTDRTDRRDMFIGQKLSPRRGLFTLRFDGIVPVLPAGVTPAQRLSSFINQLVLQGVYHADTSYDNLRVPFRSVATDIISGDRVVFDSGDLVQALRASISIPLVFAPVKMGDMQLVDGGLVSNIPVDIARINECDIVIAVNTTSGMRSEEQLGAPWEYADQIITIMQQRWNRDQLRLADVIITPPIDEYAGSDFDKMSVFIEEGRRSAREAINEIRRRIDNYYASLMEADSVVYQNPLIKNAGGAANNDSLHTIPTGNNLSRPELIRKLNTIYASGWYRDVYASVNRDDHITYITLHKEKNPVLRRVHFIGNHHIGSDTLSEILSELIDLPLNHNKMRLALERVLLKYRTEGYSLAKIQGTDFDDSTGVLTVDINEGTLGAMVIKGNRQTRGYVIRREFPIRPGDVFKVDDAMRGVRNINGTGLFNQVLIGVRQTDSEPELIVNVDERYPDLMRLSMRIDETNHFQPMVELRNENLFGHGIQAGFSIGGGLQNRIYQVDYIVHRLFNTYVTSGVTGFYRFDDIPVYRDDPESSKRDWIRIKDGEYRQRKWGANISIGTQFERVGNLSYIIRLENHKIEERETGTFNPDTYTLVAQRISTMFDTFDKYPYPGEGVSFEAYYESALSLFGSEVSYSKFYINYESYNTFFRRHTLRPRIIFGFGDETLPLSEKFLFGGKDLFYGLREYDNRGRQILVLSFEYRFLLPFKIFTDAYLSARYDVGSVWTKPEDIRLKDFIHGIGIGLGFDSGLLGPIEIAVGRAYQSRGDIIDQTVPSGPLQTYFSIGYPLP